MPDNRISVRIMRLASLSYEGGHQFLYSRAFHAGKHVNMQIDVAKASDVIFRCAVVCIEEHFQQVKGNILNQGRFITSDVYMYICTFEHVYIYMYNLGFIVQSQVESSIAFNIFSHIR